jgi:DinB superfamily
MKSVSLLFTLLMMSAGSYLAFAQHGTSTQRASLSQVDDHYISDAEHALVPVAEAMPENKYGFIPANGEFKGVRTFADMVKHVAASNYGMAGAILHENPPVKLDSEADLDAITTKADTVKFLQGSFDFLHKALGSINEKNETELIQSPDSDQPLARLEVADRAVTHCWNHYGQLVEYLRMNGIVPPGSHR